MWGFTDIREQAIRQATGHLSAHERILLGRNPKFRVATWIEQGYQELIKSDIRENELKTYTEALGSERTTEIMYARLQFLQDRYNFDLNKCVREMCAKDLGDSGVK
jgi:hypothetical protein